MLKFSAIPGAPYKFDYPAVFASIRDGQRPAIDTYRQLCKVDLFFLLYFGLGRVDINREWIVARIRDCETHKTDTLDLWAREHYKSTIRTYAEPIQDLILDPEDRIGLFSHTRPIAKGFLRQIKQTLESDVQVKKWFPDIFYNAPQKQAPKWSEDDGIMVKRRSSAKEASVEAWGLVDGQPTSKHFTKRIYDDIVTKESVTTPEQIKKTQDAYELSHSLGTDGGRKRVVGTHYHFADLYMHLRKNPGYKVSVHPATKDGTATGEPVLLSKERLEELLREQGPYVFSCQQLLSPVAGSDTKFKLAWLKYYDTLPSPLNKYLICDPANEKKKASDYTTMAVIGLDIYNNRFLCDLIRDKLDLGERWEALKGLWLTHRPLRSGYEKYGMQSDLTYFDEKMKHDRVFFRIIPLGGQTSKTDRIERFIPLCNNGQFYLPNRLPYTTKYNPEEVDLIKAFIEEEYTPWPYSAHDDILDVISRIQDDDLRATCPAVPQETNLPPVAETDFNVI